MHWKQKDKKVIGYGLRVTVYWVECVASERSWNDPFMMRLVDVLIQERDM